MIKTLLLGATLLLVDASAEQVSMLEPRPAGGEDTVGVSFASKEKLSSFPQELRSEAGTLKVFTPRVDVWQATSRVQSLINLQVQLPDAGLPHNVVLHVRTSTEANTAQLNQFNCHHEIANIRFPDTAAETTEHLRTLVYAEVGQVLQSLPLNLCWPAVKLNTVKNWAYTEAR